MFPFLYYLPLISFPIVYLAGMNGDIPHCNSTPCPAPDTGQIQELEEERKILQQQLSNMPEPAVGRNIM